MKRFYTRDFLKSISASSTPKKLCASLWRCLVNHGLSKKPIRRGCRAGQRKNTRSEATAPIWSNNNLENSEASEAEDERDKRESRKAELGRYLSVIDWSVLFSSSSDCQEMLNIFNKAIHIGLDILMPIKRVRVNTRDAPLMTDKLKSLIIKRQKAFHEHGGESPQYKFYRNTVNRERESVKASFYQLKVEHMQEENPKVWWKEVKRLCGAKPSAVNVTSHIHIEGIEDMSYKELANVINQAFLEPLEEYRLTQPLIKLPVDEDSPELLEVSELRVMKLLASLNPSKACGPDDFPNWLLKEYAELLAFPVSKIINASFEEQSLPRI